MTHAPEPLFMHNLRVASLEARAQMRAARELNEWCDRITSDEIEHWLDNCEVDDEYERQWNVDLHALAGVCAAVFGFVMVFAPLLALWML